MALLFGYEKTEGNLFNDGFTMLGDIDMDSNKIKNLPDPSTDTEPVTKQFADANYKTGERGPPGPPGPSGGPKGDKRDKGDTGHQGQRTRPKR